MQAEELVQQGELDQALETLQNSIRKAPSDAKLRVFLFQLLCIRGDWERALTQLKVSSDLDPLNLPMAQTYREAIRSELFRHQVFNGAKSPLIFGDPPEWVAFLLESLRLQGSGDFSKSNELRDQAFELAPTSSGEVDGQAFDWIADADSRIGPMLEAVVNGHYYWIPMQRIVQIDLEPPTDLRDLVWAPAHLTFANEGETVALIPTRYPGSESNPDSAILLSRRTEWDQPADNFYRGLGQRMFATNSNDYPILSTSQIKLHQDSSSLQQEPDDDHSTESAAD